METSDHLSVIVYAASPEDIEQSLIPFVVGWLREYCLSLPSVDDICRVQTCQELTAVHEHEVQQNLTMCIQNRYFIFRQRPIAAVFGFIFYGTHSSVHLQESLRCVSMLTT